jgi:rsbT antagonist protein RsbS
MATQVPILKQGNVLFVPIQAALSDTEMTQLRETLAAKVGELGVTGVILDVTALDVIDSFACRTLRSIAQTNRLRGAETVITGIQPEVAFAMVQLGLSVQDVRTMLDADEAMDYFRQRA